MDGLHIARVKGIDIYLHASWWFVFAFLIYSLSVNFFPNFYPGFTVAGYWIMGIVAATLLFISVLAHELTHSFVAKSFSLPVHSITLFFFGGIASIPSEEVNAKTEFWMALSGPLFSFLLGIAIYILTFIQLPLLLDAVFTYLWQINIALAIFNLIPGYPLDGGRVFRSLLLMYYKDIIKATRIAVKGGQAFAAFLVIAGLGSIYYGNFAGLWYILIGSFLWMIAKASYQQVVIKEALAQIPVSSILDRKYVSASRDEKAKSLLDKSIRTGQKGFIVEKKKKFIGIIQRKGFIPASKIKVLHYKATAYDAFKKMEEQNLPVLPVIEKNKIKGVINRNKVINLVSN